MVRAVVKRTSAMVRKRARWVVAGAGVLSLGVFLELASDTAEGDLERYDELVAHAIMDHRSPALNAVALDVTALGSTALLTLVVAVAAALLALRRQWRAVAHVLVASIGGGLCARLFKLYFARERPPELDRLAQVTTYSFPSGHAVGSSAIYATLLLLAWPLLDRRQRVLVASVAAVVIAAIGLSRIYLGVHHPTDVVAGYLVGGGWALLIAAALHPGGLLGPPRPPPQEGTGERPSGLLAPRDPARSGSARAAEDSPG